MRASIGRGGRMLLVFFLFALIAYVVVRGFELRRIKKEETA